VAVGLVVDVPAEAVGAAVAEAGDRAVVVAPRLAKTNEPSGACEPVHIFLEPSLLNPRHWGFQGPSRRRRRDARHFEPDGVIFLQLFFWNCLALPLKPGSDRIRTGFWILAQTRFLYPNQSPLQPVRSSRSDMTTAQERPLMRNGWPAGGKAAMTAGDNQREMRR
jgi:hypothetical protein